ARRHRYVEPPANRHRLVHVGRSGRELDLAQNLEWVCFENRHKLWRVSVIPHHDRVAHRIVAHLICPAGAAGRNALRLVREDVDQLDGAVTVTSRHLDRADGGDAVWSVACRADSQELATA